MSHFLALLALLVVFLIGILAALYFSMLFLTEFARNV